MMTSLWLVLLIASSWAQADIPRWAQVDDEDYDWRMFADIDGHYSITRGKTSAGSPQPNNRAEDVHDEHTTTTTTAAPVTIAQTQDGRLDTRIDEEDDDETADGSGKLPGTTQPTLTKNDNLALSKPATQSSAYSDAHPLFGDANVAVDGSLYDGATGWNETYYLCTHTKMEMQPWWAVDLGAVTDVGYIKVTTRGDCCAGRLSDFTVGLTNVSPWTTAPPVVEKDPHCAYYQGYPPLGSKTTIPCDPRSSPGRYLFIRLAGKNELTLCEVQVFARAPVETSAANEQLPVATEPNREEQFDSPNDDEKNEETSDGSGEVDATTQQTSSRSQNLALNQPAIQSTHYSGFPSDQGLASLATDGSLYNYRYWKLVYPCTHTDIEDQPWWAVDLGAVKDVGHIKVTTRADCCAERLSSFTVGLTNVSPWTSAPPVVEQGPPCAFYQGSPRLGSTTTISCDPRSSPGRYLFIRLAGRNYLTLCEVEVFARAPCAPVTFSVDCSQTEYAVDELGCKTCRCNQPPPTVSSASIVSTPSTVTLRTGENLALHRPATQSSPYLGDGAGLAGQAVDGSLQPQWQNSPRLRFLCTHTNIEDQPWWAVDLGAVTNVGHIKVTTRSDCCTERLSNFTVGQTNVSPWTTAPPVVEQGPPCAFYQGYPRLRSTTTIHCDPRSSPGRYLFIRLAGRSYLTLCEVEVFARAPCSPVTCSVDCSQTGHAVDELGCKTCRCNPPSSTVSTVSTASTVSAASTVSTDSTPAIEGSFTDFSTARSVQVTHVYRYNSTTDVINIQEFKRLLAESVRQLLAADPTYIQQLHIDATDEAGRIRVTFDIKTPDDQEASKLHLESVLKTLGQNQEVTSIANQGVTYTPVPETLTVKKFGGEGAECKSGSESKWARERLIVICIAVVGGMLLLCAVCVCLIAYKKLCNPSEKIKHLYSQLYQKA